MAAYSCCPHQKYYEPGSTAPPFHPNCRTTTVPWFDDFQEDEQRATRNEEDNTYYTVPADMTYKEWAKRAIVDEKVLKNDIDSGSITKGRIPFEQRGKDLQMEKDSTFTYDLQIFAESDIANQDSGSLKRAIRNYTKRIQEHDEKITNPEKYISDWNRKDIRAQEGLLKHWRKEIHNFNQSINDRIDELKQRGDYDG